MAALERALALDSSCADVWHNKGAMLAMQQRYDEALVAYEQALALDPTFVWAWHNKGNALGRLQRYDEALAAYEQVLALEPDAFTWTNKGDMLAELHRDEEALAAYEQALALDADDTQTWNAKGDALFRQRRYEEALTAYEQALALDPAYALAWHNKGNALDRLHQDEQALFAFERALAFDPRNAWTWQNKGHALTNLQRHAEALAAFEQALTLNPTFTLAWRKKGDTLVQLERYDEAVAAFEQALTLDPANALARRTNGVVLLQLQRYEEALATFEEVLRREPEDARVWAGKGLALHQLGRYAEALAAYDEASRFLPDDPMLHAARAQAQQALGKTTVDQRLRLRDGRWLGYLDYGDPAGTPIICCHGTPGSRLESFGDENLLRELHIRLIVPDRPGYGQSSFQRRRRLLDWPADVAQLADHLGLARFALLGVSGGGPHALACAVALGPRLTRVGVVSGPAPAKLASQLSHLAPRERVSFVIARFFPWPIQWALYALVARVLRAYPDRVLAIQHIRTAPRPQDGQDGGQPAQANLSFAQREQILEPYRQGARGHAWDVRICYRRWGFRPRDLAGVEIHLWHGERDQLAPAIMGRALAEAIPGCHATFYADEGHRVFGTHRREILTTLAAPSVAAQ